MPAERTPMRKIREILRLKWTSQLSNREIAKSCSTARSTVAGCLERASKAALSWPLPESLDDTALEHLLYPPVVVSGLIKRDRLLIDHPSTTRSIAACPLIWYCILMVNVAEAHLRSEAETGAAVGPSVFFLFSYLEP